MAYTIGLDYGTNSVRAVIVDVTNGNELGTAVYEYETGEAGIILDPSDHNLARQNPADYIKGIEVTVKEVIKKAKKKVKIDGITTFMTSIIIMLYNFTNFITFY